MECRAAYLISRTMRNVNVPNTANAAMMANQISEVLLDFTAGLLD